MLVDQDLSTSVYPWLTTAWNRLTTSYRSNQLPHACLLTSDIDLGYDHFVHQFAQWILCEQRTENSACGHCHQCELVISDNHPDKITLELTSSGTIVVDEVRKLYAQVYQSSQQGGYKVIIINPVEGLNQAAANALLKCLEEPAKDTLFLLVAQSGQPILPTIKSRCVSITSRLNEAVAIEWIKQHVDIAISDQQLMRLLSYAQGSPLHVVELIQSGEYETWFEWRDQWEQWLQGKHALTNLVDNELNIINKLSILLTELHEIICFLQGIGNVMFDQPIKEKLNKVSIQKIYVLIDHIQKLFGLLKRRSPLNHALALTNVLIEIRSVLS